ncbi:MAG: hypothetical protein HKP30_05935 [Myxococcales bacterium]|nr:hypothetical protein [Myxococcales bacterium]
MDFAGGPFGEPPDANCTSASLNREKPKSGCGLGTELALLLPLLAGLRRMRGARRR